MKAPINESTSFNEVTIGSQVWMVDNLNLAKFRNGDAIPYAKTAEEWEEAGQNKQAAWCYYDNKPENGTKYGRLYNWYAVNDPRGLAPKGWHIPSDDEWTLLTDYLGEEDDPGTKMKSTNGWGEEGNGTNSSGFNGVPGGERFGNGIFDGIGTPNDNLFCTCFGTWWSSTVSKGKSAWVRILFYSHGSVQRGDYGKERGFSVRCLRD